MNALRYAASLLAVSLLVTACGSSGSSPTPDAAITAPAGTAAPAASEPAAATPADATTPAANPEPTAAPTPKPTPEPTPAPVDASNDFVKAMSALRATIAIDGSAATGSTDSAITGAMKVSDPSSDTAQTTTTGKARVATHVIVSGGTRYTTAYGLWFDSGAPSDDSLPALLTSIDGGVIDLGTVTKTGQELHQLSISPPATAAAAIGVPAKGSSDVAVTIDAWVEEDGTPVFMALGATWMQTAGKKTVDASRTLELTFSDVGSAVTVSAPDQLWKMNSSKVFNYRVAYPVDWLFDKGKKKGNKFWPDAYWGYDTDVVFAGSATAGGTKLGYISSNYKRFMDIVWSAKSVKVTSNKPAKLGNQGARKIDVSYKIGKTKYYAQMYLTVKNGKFYYIELRSKKKLTAEDKEIAAGFARSFAIK